MSKKKKIEVPIWGLVNDAGELVFWAETRKTTVEQRWHDDERLVKLMIVERK